MKGGKKAKGKSPKHPKAREVQQNFIEPKQPEVQGHQDSEFHQAIIASATEGICACHDVPEFPYVRFTVWNAWMIEITGYTMEEINTSGWYQSVYPDPEVQASAKARMDRMRQGDNLNQEEWEITRKDGQRRHLLISTRIVLGGETGVNALAVMNDITERKRTEEALKESERKFRDTLLNLDEGYYSVTIDGSLLEHNWAFNRILEFPLNQDLRGTKLPDFWQNPDDRQDYLRALMSNGSISNYPVNAKTQKGNKITAIVSAHIVKDENDRPQRIEGVFLDITERKRMEETLRESEDRYRDLVEYSHDLLCTHDLEGKLLSVNPAVLRIGGYSKDELLGMNFGDFLAPEVRGQFGNYLTEIQAKGAASGVMLVQTKGGEKRLWEYHNTLRTEGVASPIVRGMARDITEHKRAEEALKQGEERYRTLVEESFDGIFIQKGTKIIFANRHLYEMLGYDKSELEGMDHWLVYHPDYQALTRERAKARMGGEEVSSQYEVKLQRKDGSAFDGEILARRIMFGDEPGIQVWVRDITERKRAEEALRESEERFRNIAEATSEYIWETDAQARYSYATERIEAIFGRPLADIVGHKPFDFMPPEEARRIRKLMSEAARRKQPFRDLEHKTLRPDGTVFWQQVSGIPLFNKDGDVAGYRGTASDITERKRAEEDRRKSEEFQRSMIACSPVALYSIDLDGNVLTWNASAERVFGWAAEEVVGKPLPIVPEDKQEEFREIRRRVMLGQTLSNLEIVRRKKDGTRLDGSLSTAPILDAEGNVIGIMSALVDITERKRAEETLRISEEKYRTILENIEDGYFEVDIAGNFTFYNDSLCSILGYSRDEMIGMNNRQYTDNENAKKLYQTFNRVYRTGKPTKESDWGIIRKDGTKRSNEASVSLIKDLSGNRIGFRGIVRDITERKQAEEEKAVLLEQLRQSQKIEAIGRLSGGIAHDFNNILTIISGNAQLSLLDLKQGDPLRENIEEIRRASERAADLTRQLLAFSRKQIMEMQVLDLNHVVQGLDKMLHRLLGEDIDLVTVLPEGIGKVKADPGQIEQVIVNLAVNARDAMIEGGKLTIETANVELDEEYARKHIAVIPGRYVMLSVSDTGVGMTSEVKERVFEPFFTTKEQGKGTGLGLSTVYGIVKQSGGNIWVYSEPDKGTTFKIYLPGVDEPIEESEEKGVKEEILTGSETILVVEDDEEVRKLAVRILKKQGYNVLEASQGLDAFLICEEHEEPMHLLLTDVVMPKMSGRELADRIVSIHPEIKVLFMSGYTDNAIAHHGILEKGTNFMQKPFTLENLARKVREVLDK